jgi:hypothetical protein
VTDLARILLSLSDKRYYIAPSNLGRIGMGNDPCHCHCGELHVVVPSFRFPLTIVMQSFIFFGFLVAGEEIESKHSF